MVRLAPRGGDSDYLRGSPRLDVLRGADAQTVWGYYTTQGPDGPLLWAERYDLGPRIMWIEGDTFAVQPTLTACPCPATST